MPKVAIIRFDDSDCGQSQSAFWKNRLLGSETLVSSEETREWLGAWHTITHGAVPKDALSWNYEKRYGSLPHRSFAPCNSPIVYDENVGAEDLEGLELAFLCGLYMSEATLGAVAGLVKNGGLVAVTSPRFAPAEFAAAYTGGTAEFADGRGRWVITDDMACGEVYEAVKPMLGDSGEMAYRFGGNTIALKISEDGNSFC